MSFDIISLKKPSLKRDDFLSVLEALIEKKVYPGEIHNKLVLNITEKYNLKNICFLPSKWVGVKIFLQIEKIKEKFKKVFISNNSDLFYYHILKDEGLEIIPVDLDIENLVPVLENIKSEIDEKSFFILSFPYGYPVDFSEIEKLNVPVFADLSGSFGVLYKSKFLGKNFDFLIYSFKDEDIITCGDGCMMIIKDEKRFLNYYKIVEDFNLKLSDYNSALLFSQLEKFEKIRNSRKKLFYYYKEQIKNEEKIQIIFDREFNDENVPNYNNFILRVKENYDELLMNSKKYNIEIQPLINKPISFILNNSKKFPNSIKIASEYYKIPFYPVIDKNTLDRVSVFLNKISS